MTFLRHVFAPLTGSVFGLALGLGVGCSAIVSPDDQVERCDNFSDCDVQDDNRFFSQCIKEDNDVPGVCVAALKEDVPCDGDAIANSDPTSEFAQIWMEFGGVGRYSAGCDADAGVAGCGGPCSDGLELNGDGVCDDTDPNTPKAVPAKPDLAGADIADQYCRSFFCDTDFVCQNGICSPCADDDEVGDGGCGNLYMEGARSCIYTDRSAIEDGQCAAPDSNRDAVVFGNCD
jgi:hypothetical protein